MISIQRASNAEQETGEATNSPVVTLALNMQRHLLSNPSAYPKMCKTQQKLTLLQMTEEARNKLPYQCQLFAV